ncbi:MAG: ORF6N domain-containing protein [Ignavibacteriales bacterium]|nr:ORF6N domain-containing protein [Ignavibacteriales bacterium]
MKRKSYLVSVAKISSKILWVRGEKILLDRDLAQLYGVEVKVLNQSVRRNIERFPSDFMLQLSKEEFLNLKSQFVTSSWGGVRKLPLAFTEQGVAMLSSILSGKRAIQVNIAIMRAFVELRRMIDANKELLARIEKLEKNYNAKFQIIFEAIKQLMKEEEKPTNKIGF